MMRQRSGLILACAAAALAVCTPVTFAQIVNGSFEDGLSGWTTGGPGTPQSWAFVDADMPTDGTAYGRILALNSTSAIPHSNPGGFGADASGTIRFEQQFTISTFASRLELDCQLTTNANQGEFLEVSIQANGMIYNAIHLDSSSTGAGTPGGFGASTSVNAVSVDLPAIFAGVDSSTIFTLRLHAGNIGAITPITGAYFDNVRLTSGSPVPGVASLFSHSAPLVLYDAQSSNPNRECYNLIAFTLADPLGSGPLLGLAADTLVFTILSTPLVTSGLHFVTNGIGRYAFPIPDTILPSGFQFDYLLLVLSGGQVEEFTPPTRFTWP